MKPLVNKQNMMWNESIQTKGSVILAGAGPGDPDLITVKLQKCIALADVIISDRLVHPLIWEQYAKPDVELIMAGKQGYNDASCTQAEVSALIIQHATAHKRVLRLKGGDVAFFSNVLDELEQLIAHQIPYEIIPGITAASGASAYLGMPLTARGYAQSVQFISFNPTAVYNDAYWKNLATTEDTRVLYMASRNLELFIHNMLHFGADNQTPIAVIEQATTPQQKCTLSTLGKANEALLPIVFASPSLVIVGNVVNLHDSFSWFDPKEKGSVFLSL